MYFIGGKFDKSPTGGALLKTLTFWRENSKPNQTVWDWSVKQIDVAAKYVCHGDNWSCQWRVRRIFLPLQLRSGESRRKCRFSVHIFATFFIDLHVNHFAAKFVIYFVYIFAIFSSHSRSLVHLLKFSNLKLYFCPQFILAGILKRFKLLFLILFFFLIEKKIFFTANNLNQKRYVLAHYFCLALLARHRRYTWFLQSWKHDNKIEDVRFKRADHTLLFYQHIAEYSNLQLNTFFFKIQEKIKTNEKMTHEKKTQNDQILFWKIGMLNLNLIWRSKVKKYDNNQINIFLNMKYLFIGWKILWDEIHHEWKRLRNNT